MVGERGRYTIKQKAYNDFDAVGGAGRGSLFVGAAPLPELAFTRTFDTIVFASKDFQPPAEQYPGVEIIRAPMADGELTPRQVEVAQAAAKAVAVRVAAGKTVLVTCVAGVNRSAFIAALALVMTTGKPGWWALNHIRARRQPRSTAMMPLANSDFAGYLMTISGVKPAGKVS